MKEFFILFFLLCSFFSPSLSVLLFPEKNEKNEENEFPEIENQNLVVTIEEGGFAKNFSLPSHEICPKEGKKEKIGVLICDPRRKKYPEKEVRAIASLLKAVDRSGYKILEFYNIHGFRIQQTRESQFWQAVKSINFTSLEQINAHFYILPFAKVSLRAYEYSNFFKDPSFWGQLAQKLCPEVSHLLVTQYDVLYSENPLSPSLVDFLGYDYIGSCVNSSGFPAGCYNFSIVEKEMCCCIGGVSLRSLRSTLLAFKKYPPRKMVKTMPISLHFVDNHEDLYFYGAIGANGGKMPTDQFSLQFSDEDNWNECGKPPFAFHRLALPRKAAYENEDKEECQNTLKHLKWELGEKRKRRLLQLQKRKEAGMEPKKKSKSPQQTSVLWTSTKQTPSSKKKLKLSRQESKVKQRLLAAKKRRT